MIYDDCQRYDKSWLSGGAGQEETAAAQPSHNTTLTSPHQAMIDLGRNFLRPDRAGEQIGYFIFIREQTGQDGRMFSLFAQSGPERGESC